MVSILRKHCGSLGPPRNPSGSSAASCAPVSYVLVSTPVSSASASTMGALVSSGTAGEFACTAGEFAGVVGTSSSTMTGTRHLHADAVGLRRWGAPSESSPSLLLRPLATTLPNA